MTQFTWTAIDDVQLNAEVNEAVLQDDEGNSQGTLPTPLAVPMQLDKSLKLAHTPLL